MAYPRLPAKRRNPNPVNKLFGGQVRQSSQGYPQVRVPNHAGSRERGKICPVTPRFLTLADVADTLNISASQTYALVRSGELKAIKVGGRGQWRVESSELETYIADAYQQTAEFVATHPFGREDEGRD